MLCNPHGYWVLCFGKAFFAPICTPVLVWIPPVLSGLAEIHGYELRR